MLSFLQLGEGNVGTMSERRGMAKESRKRRIARYRNEATSPLVIEDNSDERKSKRGEEGDECVTYPCEEAEVDYYLHPTGERKLRGWWQNIRGGEWVFHLFSWQRVLINFHGGSFFNLFFFNSRYSFVLIVSTSSFEWLSYHVSITLLYPWNTCVRFILQPVNLTLSGIDGWFVYRYGGRFDI